MRRATFSHHTDRTMIRRFFALLIGAHLIDGVLGAYLPLAAAAGAGPGAVGLISFAALLPWLAAPVVGVAVDRHGAVGVLTASTWARLGVLVAATILGWWSGVDAGALGLLMVFAFCAAAVEVATDVSSQSAASRLVPPERVADVYGGVSTVQTVCGSLAAPGLAGLAVGIPVTDVLGILAVGAAVTLLIRLPRAGRPEKSSVPVPDTDARGSAGFRSELRIGLRTILADNWLLRTMCTVGALNILAAGSSAVALVYYVQDIGVDARTVGLVFSMVGVAAAVGGVAAPRVARRIGFRGTVMVGAAGLLMTTAAPLAGTSMTVIALILVSAGLFVPCFGVSLISERQRRVDRSRIGRVNGTFQMVGVGVAPVGAVAAGFGAEGVGAVPVLLTGVVLAVVALAAGRPWVLTTR